MTANLLETRITETKVTETSGIKYIIKIETLTEYKISRLFEKVVYEEFSRRKYIENQKRDLAWTQNILGVPSSVVKMGEVAISIWKREGRKPSKREVDEIERDLGGCYS